MRGKNDARIHTGRNDRNSRPRGSRRRTEIVRRWAPPSWLPSVEEAQDLGDSAFEERFKARQIDWTQAETWDEGLDGVHPVET